MDPDAALKQLTTAIQGAIVLDMFVSVVTMIAMMLSDSMWLFPNPLDFDRDSRYLGASTYRRRTGPVVADEG